MHCFVLKFWIYILRLFRKENATLLSFCPSSPPETILSFQSSIYCFSFWAGFLFQSHPSSDLFDCEAGLQVTLLNPRWKMRRSSEVGRTWQDQVAALRCCPAGNGLSSPTDPRQESRTHTPALRLLMEKKKRVLEQLRRFHISSMRRLQSFQTELHLIRTGTVAQRSHAAPGTNY